MPLPAFYEQHLMESDDFKKLQASHAADQKKRRDALLKEFAVAAEQYDRSIIELTEQRATVERALVQVQALVTVKKEELLAVEYNLSQLVARWETEKRRQFLAINECLDESLQTLLAEIEAAIQQAEHEFRNGRRTNQAGIALVKLRDTAQERGRTVGCLGGKDVSWFRDQIRSALTLP